jgi:A/G-specific adenine glycosylase
MVAEAVLAKHVGVLKARRQTNVIDGAVGFRSALARWFERHGMDYPWRRTRDAYAVLVSEVMLQQTQIATVLGKGYYTRFLEVFPDWQALAAADDAGLLKAWEGLGYYRRARMLRETARAVLRDFGGVFPSDVAAMRRLPGVGPYTAGALRAFAFEMPAVLVDGNVARVLARLFDFNDPVDTGAGIRQLWEWAEQLADGKHPRIYHAALMELGQRICRRGVPDCVLCPVARYCAAREPECLPVKSRKISITRIDEHAIWLRDADGRLLLHHEGGKRRTGLWHLPIREAVEIGHLPILAHEIYAITRYRVTMHVHDGTALAPSFRPGVGESWRASHEVPILAMAAPFRRVVEKLWENY